MPVLGHQQVLHYGHVAEQPDVLKSAHHPHAGNFIVRLALNGLPFEQNLPAGGFVKPADTVENGGFAGTVRADDGDDLVLLHIHAYLIHRQQAAEAHGQIFHFQHIGYP